MSNSERSDTQAPLLDGASKREQSVTTDWSVLTDPIAGVELKEIRSVIKKNGYLTEIYRTDWNLDDKGVDQAFQVLVNPGSTEAWHVHKTTTDRFFVSSGRILLVLYDSREGSRSFGRINEFHMGIERPTLVVVPPGVWHGIQNIGSEAAVLINLVDEAYVYRSPDHWSLPADTDQIPYRFQT